MLALGLVETKGLVGAIEAADVMLKTASVHLLEKTLASGGLVTITIAGDVAEVQASVSAAKVTLGRLAGVELVSCHVIPRPDLELKHILRLDPKAGSDDGPKGGGQGKAPLKPQAPEAANSKAMPASQTAESSSDLAKQTVSLPPVLKSETRPAQMQAPASQKASDAAGADKVASKGVAKSGKKTSKKK